MCFMKLLVHGPMCGSKLEELIGFYTVSQVHDSEKMAAAVLTVQEQFLIRREEWLRVMDNSVRKSIVPLLHSFGENIQKIFSGPEK